MREARGLLAGTAPPWGCLPPGASLIAGAWRAPPVGLEAASGPRASSGLGFAARSAGIEVHGYSAGVSGQSRRSSTEYPSMSRLVAPGPEHRQRAVAMQRHGGCEAGLRECGYQAPVRHRHRRGFRASPSLLPARSPARPTARRCGCGAPSRIVRGRANPGPTAPNTSRSRPSDQGSRQPETTTTAIATGNPQCTSRAARLKTTAWFGGWVPTRRTRCHTRHRRNNVLRQS